MIRLWHRIFLEHPYSTDNPQGYWSHGIFSIVNSFKGLWYMVAGVIHGLLPCLFPFSTSSYLIRSFKKLVDSNRHKEELHQILDENILVQLKRDMQTKYSGYHHPDLEELAKLKNDKLR